MILKLKRTPGIYLVGFMGCGKTTVGQTGRRGDRLAVRRSRRRHRARAAGSSITHLFSTVGEEAFRQLEHQALMRRVHRIQSGHPTVLALGGGTFTRDDNIELANDNGVSIWIDATIELVRTRVSSSDHRPLAKDPRSSNRSTGPGGMPTPVPTTASRRSRTTRKPSPCRSSTYPSSTNDACTSSDCAATGSVSSAAAAGRRPRQAIRGSAVTDGRFAGSAATGRISSITSTSSGPVRPAAAMATAVEKMLGRRINEGWINVKDGHTASSCAASISTSAGTLSPTSAASAAPRRSRASPRRRASGTWSSA